MSHTSPLKTCAFRVLRAANFNTSLPRLSGAKLARLPVSFCFIFLLAVVCRAQFFTLPGSFSYSLNSINQVFDVSPDGRLAVALRNHPTTVHPAFLTTFDPVTGAQFDSKTFGFGPLGVQLAEVEGGLRAVVLTSEGGPRRIYLFDVSADGKLTQLATTQLTTSNGDAGSNIVLSGKAKAGFALVADGSLVAFSLVDGSILSKIPVSNTGALEVSEASDRVILAYGLANAVFVDVTNPAQMNPLGSVPLPGGGPPAPGMTFSPDGRYLFVGNNSTTLSAIDVATRQVVGTMGGGFVFGRVRIHEDGQRRLLAVVGAMPNLNQSSVLLVDATDVGHMSVTGQFPAPVNYKSDLQFSPDGARLFVATTDRLTALEVPSLATAWVQTLPSSATREHQVMTFGHPGEVLAAWEVSAGLGFTSMFGSFPAYPPDITLSDASAAEGGAVEFTVALSIPATRKITIDYATADGTAGSPSDYAGGSASFAFEPGQTQKVISLPTVNDAIDEFDETFKLNLTKASVGTVKRGQGTATISDDDPPPSVTLNDLVFHEGDSGVKAVSVEVLLSGASGKTVTVNFATADGTASAGSDYSAVSGVITFAPGQTRKLVSVNIVGDTAPEPDETVLITLSSPSNATLDRAQGVLTLLNDEAKVQFDVSEVSVTEGTAHSVTLNVTRTSDLSTPTSVSYDTMPGTASDMSDYTAAYGTLRFAPNESSKSITILITDDAWGEAAETFTVGLFDVTGGSIGARGSVTVRINSNEAADGPNPVRATTFDPQFFVRQHYHDFLNREPDAAGLAFWSNQATNCGNSDLLVCRINVSAAFFLSPEFQDTGFYAIRVQRVAFGRESGVEGRRLGITQFIRDARQVGEGFVGGAPGSEQVLEQNRQAYATQIVSSPDFIANFPVSLSATQYAEALFAKAGLAGTAAELQAVANAFNSAGGGTAGRVAALRSVAESSSVREAEFRTAFVLMQYFGYMRRDPDKAGYDFWLGKLNEFNGNYVAAEMVKAFITSAEYEQRFGN
jgi:hypothetical protein